ncbi:MAG TPA: TonB-dependent receptor, partial [Pyrinomonadaceae bacterium]|nr:TonB-dependent receptor [Pyrinomonadaceae bacterium]
ETPEGATLPHEPRPVFRVSPTARLLLASQAPGNLVNQTGIPFNDPFGGWVQWERVPAIAVDQVEVLRGGASSLYGNYALSGAVNIIPRKPEKKYTFSSDVFVGSQQSFGASGFGGFDSKNWSIDGTAAAFQTRGSKPIDPAVQGPVDGYAGVRYTSFLTRISRKFGDNTSVFVRPAFFGEVRTNGTGLQTNRSHIRGLTTGGTLQTNELKFEFRAFGGTQGYDQTFSAVNTGRTVENLIRIQRVPSQNVGGSVVMSGSLGRHSLVGGIDMRQVRGASDEVAFSNNLATTKAGSGGQDNGVGIFLRDAIKLSDKLAVVAGARIDHWRNSNGRVSSIVLSTSAITDSTFAYRSETAFSPHLALLYTLNDGVSVYASGSSSFRSPTLNELYRSFRVGNVNTLANADLSAERAVNFESGVTFRRNGLGLRTAAFYTEVSRPIANVTLTTMPTLITRQRQNMGRNRIAGFEAEFDATFRSIYFAAGYQFVDPTAVEFDAEPSLVGLRVPQVARHQATFRVRYDLTKWTFALQGRAAGEQFDDDQNQFRLEPY